MNAPVQHPTKKRQLSVHVIPSAIPRPLVAFLLAAALFLPVGAPLGAAAAQVPAPETRAATASAPRAVPGTVAKSFNEMSDAEIARVLRSRPAPRRAARTSRTEAPAVPPVPAEPAAAAEPEPEPAPAPAPAPNVFALVEGEPLVSPTDNVRGVGFHEINTPNGVPLEPVGDVRANLNPGKVAALPPDTAGEAYMILPPRNRAGAGTRAADVRVNHGDQVHAVVTGRVRKVTDYALYGRYPDQVVDIVPAAKPHLVVRMYHLEGVSVAEGQEVVAGETVVAASGRQLPFESQIDRYAGHGPHVHVEVRHEG